MRFTRDPEPEGGKRLSGAYIGALVRAADLLIIVAVGLAVYWIYPATAQGGWNTQYLASILTAVLTAATLFQWFGAYKGEFLFSRYLRLGRLVVAWACVFCILLAIAFALKITGSYSRVWYAAWFVSTGAVLGCGRVAIGCLMRRWIRRGRFINRTAIVGAGEQGRRVAAHLERHHDGRTCIIGYIDNHGDGADQGVEGCNFLGDTETLLEMIRGNRIDQVFIALPWNAITEVREVAEALSTTPVRVYLAPDLLGFEFADREYTRISGIPMLHIFDRPISGWSHVSKTFEDMLLGCLLLVFFSPLMLLTALAIRLTSRGPVLFRQKRQGFNDELFEVWKFRTMHKRLEDPNCDVQTTPDDPRVTPVGRFLRKFGLDELPQLFNVLRGDMSIVGPRPHSPGTKAQGRFFSEAVDRSAARHRVKPGITGWAQMNGLRGETDTIEKIRNRVDHDLYYIDNWSIWLDLMIILRTPFAMLSAKNAY